MYSIGNIVNSNVITLKVAKRVDLKSSHYKKRILELCVVVDIVDTVVIISQYIQIWNHYIVHLKRIYCVFKKYLFIYLFGCAGSSLQQAGSLVVACELLVAACMWDLVP